MPLRHCIEGVVVNLFLRVLYILLDRLFPFVDSFLLREGRLFRVELIFGWVDMKIQPVILFELQCLFLNFTPLLFPIFVFLLCLCLRIFSAIGVTMSEPSAGVIPSPVIFAVCGLCLDLLELDVGFGRFRQEGLRLRFEHQHLAILLAFLLQDGFPFGEGLVVAHCLAVFGVQLFDKLFLLRLCPVEFCEFGIVALDLYGRLDIGFMSGFENFLLLFELLAGLFRFANEVRDYADKRTDSGDDPSEYGDRLDRRTYHAESSGEADICDCPRFCRSGIENLSGRICSRRCRACIGRCVVGSLRSRVRDGCGGIGPLRGSIGDRCRRFCGLLSRAYCKQRVPPLFEAIQGNEGKSRIFIEGLLYLLQSDSDSHERLHFDHDLLQILVFSRK